MSDFDPRDSTAIRLAMAIKRLRVRLREAGAVGPTGLPISQLAILRRLRDDGPSTAAALATAERVSQQAIAQNLTALKDAGLVEATTDPVDARKRLISVTDTGNRLFETAVASRNAWLEAAISAAIAPEERPLLEDAIDLLERLAAVNLPRSNG
jgi:DNA-binding MarR family transcriptional regulator